MHVLALWEANSPLRGAAQRAMPSGATGGGEKSGARSFIAPIRSFEPTTERNPRARNASAQWAMAGQLPECEMLPVPFLQSHGTGLKLPLRP